MDVHITLRLPRDTASAPIARQTLGLCLDTLGVPDEIRDDLTVALSEACANVIQHATGSDDYQVRVAVTGGTCAIDVIDTGRGIDTGPAQHPPASTAETGRGLQLIAALTDNVKLTSRPRHGTIMHFEKPLQDPALTPPSATPAP